MWLLPVPMKTLSSYFLPPVVRRHHCPYFADSCISPLLLCFWTCINHQLLWSFSHPASPPLSFIVLLAQEHPPWLLGNLLLLRWSLQASPGKASSSLQTQGVDRNIREKSCVSEDIGWRGLRKCLCKCGNVGKRQQFLLEGEHSQGFRSNVFSISSLRHSPWYLTSDGVYMAVTGKNILSAMYISAIVQRSVPVSSTSAH